MLEGAHRHLGSGVRFFFFSSRRRHTRCSRDWSSDVCSSDLLVPVLASLGIAVGRAGRAWGIDGLLAGGAPRPRGDDEGICVQCQSSFLPITRCRPLAGCLPICLPISSRRSSLRMGAHLILLARELWLAQAKAPRRAGWFGEWQQAVAQDRPCAGGLWNSHPRTGCTGSASSCLWL